MEAHISASPVTTGLPRIHFTIELPKVCPWCQTSFAHAPISAVHNFVSVNLTVSSEMDVACIFACPACANLFMGRYHSSGAEIGIQSRSTHLITVYPNPKLRTSFDEKISVLSPKFVEIFHQAEIADQAGLNEICGIGYRKAIEFLIKDYLIRYNTDNINKIKEMNIMQCINTYIEDPKIKTMASRTTWLGNDETHYVRKHTDRDLHDLKDFIMALVYFINIDLIYKDADSVPSR